MEQPRALLLDLDRTLIDLQSFTDYDAALGDVESLVGQWSDADVPATDWNKATMACMGVLHSFLADPRWNDVSEAIAVHERAAIPRSHLMPTVSESAPVLAGMPTAVITLLPPEVAAAVLDFHGLDIGREIDIVVGRDPQVRPKPEADGVLEACRLLDVEPAVAAMIGDSTWDAQAALAAGVDFIGVPPDGFPEQLLRDIGCANTFEGALDLLGLKERGTPR